MTLYCIFRQTIIVPSAVKFYCALLCLTGILLANPLTPVSLKKETVFFDESRIVYSTDIAQVDTSFEVTQIQQGLSSYRLSFSVLQDIFASHGYELISPTKIAYITLKQKLDINEVQILDFIKEKYKEAYPSIVIEDISLKLSSSVSLQGYELQEMILPSNRLGYDNGNVKLNFERIQPRQHTLAKKSIYARYYMQAYIEGLVVTENIQKNTLLNAQNTTIQKIKLTKNTLPSLKPNTYYAKYRIKKDTLLTKRHIKTMPLVQKKETITAVFDIDGVQATRGATALASGYKNDIISIKVGERELKAKITAKSRVLIQ